MKNIEKIKESFQRILKEIAKRKIKNFSGLGVVLYNSKFLSSIPRFDLRPSSTCPKGIFINKNKKKVVDFLLKISQNSHPWHDGYHFFSEKGKLTHISQYLAAPIIPTIIPNELYGARHLSANFGAHIKGIIGIGIVAKDYSCTYFEKGKCYSLDPWDIIYKKGKENYNYYDITEPHRDIGEITRIFKKRKVKKILDLGCGAGRHVIYLAKKGFKVYGIDVAAEGIKITKKFLREQNLKANLKIGNIFKGLPYNDNFFDAVISVQVLQHGTLNQIKKVIRDIERILKPKGLLFITLCGRYSKGKIRYCIVKTAKKIAPKTYVPTIGNEAGIPHYVYDKRTLKKHYKNFKMIGFWKDDKDYYCFLGENEKN